ncbi:hypothetical protein AVEN_59578-1 [Araneus ventricosus]|uniref:Uncharacterized protein n=1 Tax=Araneus ventricosus TaxID=182803 RepID=A0A4Y2VVU9_ARAVE|nr:hypothetical protein AVEN_117903-1 [Araneus ventricosus]GBO28848.1 hypothetical protein AVEN_59578-1 [Araneus ventricosus]
MPFVPRQFFPTHSSRKIRHVIYRGPKVRYRRSSIPYSYFPHTADFRFFSLVAGSQSRQNLCFPVTLAAKSLKRYLAIPILFQTIRNSNTSNPLCQFSSFSHTGERFFLPMFQKSQSGTTVNAPLKSLVSEQTFCYQAAFSNGKAL